MSPTITSNSSSHQLVSSSEESTNENVETERVSRTTSVREWIAVIVLCFINLINYMDRFTLAGILEDIQKYFDINDDKGGLLQTSFVLSYMLFAPIFGYLGDRYNRKIIMAAGVFMWSLTTLLGSFMTNFWWFIFFRALVGIGEASYSTIAPTLISDLFVNEVRTKMLTLFYFAIPVGSGLGYIVGSEIAKAAGSWQWALRCTPILGVVAVLLIIFVLKDPERGQSESKTHLTNTTWTEDLKHLVKNPSFMLSTAGFTCVSFVAGSLAWWGPKFIKLGIKLQPGGSDIEDKSLSFIFGAITILAGILGLSLGFFLSKTLRKKFPRADPIICGVGLLLSAPLLLSSSLATTHSSILCFILLLIGEIALNLNWAICGDILLYVVLPTRRSTAEGFQLLIAHALGDAGSPYLIGVLSETLKDHLSSKSLDTTMFKWNITTAASEALTDVQFHASEDDSVKFYALQYALFTTCFIEILGGLFFLINAFYIVKDKQKVEKALKVASEDPVQIDAAEPEMRGLIAS